jgi:hypothetical protein
VNFGNVTHWDGKEDLDSWLKREGKERDKVENPTCPYCGNIHEEWFDISGLNHDWEVDNYELDCWSCNKKFLVDKQTKVRFESKKIETGSQPAEKK